MEARRILDRSLVGGCCAILVLVLIIGLPFVHITIPQSVVLMNTIFLSILLEAFPFILLGVFASALIQLYLTEEMVQKFIPKHALLAIVPAAIVSAILPVCECAIILVVRKLLQKGMPLHVGVIFLLGAPILNPIVFASTYYAFQGMPSVAFVRMGMAFVLTIFIGTVIYFLFRNRQQLRWSKEELIGGAPLESKKSKKRLSSVFYHASDEFFDVGKYVIIGTLVASAFQTYFDRSVLLALSENQQLAPLIMMAFAFVLSLCSEADAFIASSFAHTFSTGALLAFLVYGPMLDLKNVILLFAYFRTKFVIVLIGVITISVYVAVLLYQYAGW